MRTHSFATRYFERRALIGKASDLGYEVFFLMSRVFLTGLQKNQLLLWSRELWAIANSIDLSLWGRVKIFDFKILFSYFLVTAQSGKSKSIRDLKILPHNYPDPPLLELFPRLLQDQGQL